MKWIHVLIKSLLLIWTDLENSKSIRILNMCHCVTLHGICLTYFSSSILKHMGPPENCWFLSQSKHSSAFKIAELCCDWFTQEQLWLMLDSRKWLNLHCNPVQGQYRARTGFSLCTFPTQGKTCLHYRVPRWWKQVFPCWEKYTGKSLFSLQGWVCSVQFRLKSIFSKIF